MGELGGSALDLAQVSSIQPPLPTQLLLEAKIILAATSRDCLHGKEHLVSDGENVPWQRRSLDMFQECWWQICPGRNSSLLRNRQGRHFASLCLRFLDV